MSELAALIAQLTGSNTTPAQDPALAAVKLARASIDALVLKLGQSIDAKVTGQLAAGLTQLTAGSESFVLKLETPLPAGTAVTIRVTPTPQGTPAVTVSVPAAPHAAQPMPIQVATAPLVEMPLAKRAASPAPAAVATPMPDAPDTSQTTPRALPQATQLPLPEPAAQQPAVVAGRAPNQPALATPSPQPAPQTQVATSATVAAQPQAATPQVATSQPAQAQPTQVPTVPSTPVVAAPQAAPAPQAMPASIPQPAVATPLPAPGQPAAQVALPVTPPVTSAVTVPSAPPQAAPVNAAPAPQAATPPVTAQPNAPAQPAQVASQPAPILSAPLAAQPQQPLPTHPSPYPVHVPQAAQTAVAQQLPLPAAPRPAAPPLNLADPAQAAARQDSAAPLLAKLAALVTSTAPSLPRPVIEMALKVLANRIDLNRAPPDAKTLEAAVLKAGVLLSPPGREPAGDARTGLLALRSTLLAFLGGDTAAPVATAERPAPPLKGEPPRAPTPQVATPDLPADSHETARNLLGHTDAALSRLKLLQSASQPAADTRPDAPTPRNELRVEIPMMLGAETGILQLMVERDSRHKREPERQRGWRLRFAMKFSATGEVGADIALLGRSANVAIWAADPDTADALDTLLPELAPAIQRHGLELTSLRVRRGAPQPARTAPGQLLDSAR
jgi:hypothetical protein